MLRFSLEVVLRIVAHMGHYTVISLLRAIPEYCRYAILVTAHRHSPLFFNLLPQIERKYLYVHIPSWYSTKPVAANELFRPETSSLHPIRLFEVDVKELISSLAKPRSRFNLGHQQIMQEVASQSGNLDISWIGNPGFHNTSFVFVNSSASSVSECDAFGTRLYQQKGAKFHVGLPTYIPVGYCPDNCNVSSHIFKDPGPVFSNIFPSPVTFLQPQFLTMRLENVAVFADLEFPYLVDLVLVYNNGSDLVPVIEAIVAPEISRFVVHFDGQVPLFRKMGRFTPRMFPWEKKQRYRRSRAFGGWLPTTPDSDTTRIFELCHIDSIGGLGRGASSRDPSHQKPRPLSDLSFSFLKRFHDISVSGCAWFLLAEMNMASVRRCLNLTMTETAGHCEEDVLFDLPHLSELFITIKADSIKLPKFSVPRLRYLSVRILALNPDLTGLWKSSTYNANMNVDHVHIYSDPTLPHRASSTGDRMYVVTEPEKRRIVRMISRTFHDIDQRAFRITLNGFPDSNI